MWARFKRVVRSWFGAVVSAGEDPEQILNQNLRDMEGELLEIKNSQARARGILARVEKGEAAVRAKVEELTNQLKSALASGDETVAAGIAVSLKKARDLLKEQSEKKVAAEANAQRMQRLFEGYERELANKTKEAKVVIQDAETAKMKAELAEVYETFDSTDIAGTHEEMIARLGQTSSSGPSSADADSNAEKKKTMDADFEDLETKKILDQFKEELGMSSEQSIQLDPFPQDGKK